jgi:hypothetical protein
MLWINGNAGWVKSKLGLTAASGRGYWADDLSMAMRAVKDWNCWFVEPDSPWFGNASWRYKSGYSFAQKNLYKIRQHMLLSGNRLCIVAHGKGIDFAEGLAANLYEERGIQTEILIALEGLQNINAPQQPDAVAARIHYRHAEIFPFIKKDDTKYLADVHINEQNLASGFCRYAFQAGRFVHPLQLGNIYLRGNVPLNEKFATNRLRQFQVWTAISHGLKLLEYAQGLRLAPLRRTSLKSPLVRFQLHQN